MTKIGFNNSPRRNHLLNITFVELFVLSNKIFCDLIFTIKELPSSRTSRGFHGNYKSRISHGIHTMNSHSWVV